MDSQIRKKNIEKYERYQKNDYKKKKNPCDVIKHVIIFKCIIFPNKNLKIFFSFSYQSLLYVFFENLIYNPI